MLQINGQLKEILETASYFVDRSQEVLEVPTLRMARLENNEETPADLSAKDQQALKWDYNLVEFSINTAEDFKKAVKKTKGLCTEFFRRLLNTYNRCQIKAEESLEVFPDHEAFVELLQKRFQQEEAKVQDIKAMDDLILRIQVDHPVVSVLLLEDQL